MDVFVEQIVKKRATNLNKLLAVFYILLALILAFLFFAFSHLFSVFTIPLIAAVAFGAYWLIRSQNWEFEYAITNGDITVDKIIARRRRKRLINLDAKDVETMGKYRATDHIQRNYDKRISAARDETDDDVWYLTCRTRVHGHVLLIFSPDDRTLDAIKPFLKRQVAMDAFGRNAFNRH